ncbi:MAG TPA: hypothetical protein DD400_05570 [Rhodospirillaceae bacterium]|nr:hypothetical protein [Rhodospirillaceae bacterium]
MIFKDLLLTMFVLLFVVLHLKKKGQWSGLPHMGRIKGRIILPIDRETGQKFIPSHRGYAKKYSSRISPDFLFCALRVSSLSLV